MQWMYYYYVFTSYSVKTLILERIHVYIGTHLHMHLTRNAVMLESEHRNTCTTDPLTMCTYRLYMFTSESWGSLSFWRELKRTKKVNFDFAQVAGKLSNDYGNRNTILNF